MHHDPIDELLLDAVCGGFDSAGYETAGDPTYSPSSLPDTEDYAKYADYEATTGYTPPASPELPSTDYSGARSDASNA